MQKGQSPTIVIQELYNNKIRLIRHNKNEMTKTGPNKSAGAPLLHIPRMAILRFVVSDMYY